MYVPVIVGCDELTQLSRVSNEDRARMLKWVDPEGVRRFVRSHSLVEIDDLQSLSIDTAQLVSRKPPGAGGVGGPSVG